MTTATGHQAAASKSPRCAPPRSRNTANFVYLPTTAPGPWRVVTLRRELRTRGRKESARRFQILEGVDLRPAQARDVRGLRRELPQPDHLRVDVLVIEVSAAGGDAFIEDRDQFACSMRADALDTYTFAV